MQAIRAPPRTITGQRVGHQRVPLSLPLPLSLSLALSLCRQSPACIPATRARANAAGLVCGSGRPSRTGWPARVGDSHTHRRSCMGQSGFYGPTTWAQVNRKQRQRLVALGSGPCAWDEAHRMGELEARELNKELRPSLRAAEVVRARAAGRPAGRPAGSLATKLAPSNSFKHGQLSLLSLLVPGAEVDAQGTDQLRHPVRWARAGRRQSSQLAGRIVAHAPARQLAARPRPRLIPVDPPTSVQQLSPQPLAPLPC